MKSVFGVLIFAFSTTAIAKPVMDHDVQLILQNPKVQELLNTKRIGDLKSIQVLGPKIEGKTGTVYQLETQSPAMTCLQKVLVANGYSGAPKDSVHLSKNVQCN